MKPQLISCPPRFRCASFSTRGGCFRRRSGWRRGRETTRKKESKEEGCSAAAMVVVRTNKTHYPPQDIVASSSFGWHTNQRLGNPWRNVQFRGRDEAYLEDSFPRRGKNDEGRRRRRRRRLPRRARPTLTTSLDSSSRFPALPLLPPLFFR